MKYCTYCYKILDEEYQAKKDNVDLMREFIAVPRPGYRCTEHWGIQFG